MNKSKQIAYKFLLPVLFLATNFLNAQTQKKTYSETFNVNENTVLNINTSHTDIEFQTWNKNQVQVEAVIELEGASEEEAEEYFKNKGIKILGNSSEIEISTRGGSQIAGVHGNIDDMVIEIPELPEIEPFFLDIEIPDLPEIPFAELPPMPPMPPMSFAEFDYEEYKERGEEYLKEWSEEFQKNFDEDWSEQMKEWGEQLKANMKEYEQMREERREEHKMLREERMKERVEMRKEMREIREEVREERERVREEQREVRRNVIISTDQKVSPNIFYYSSDGKSGKYKVKRSIKIKMPNSVKLNMNVRHGEVKLADNTRDINATLSYARLLASTIDGDQTKIVAAYTPVRVEQWNLGKLNTKFSGDIELKDVKHLTLDAISSEITIDRLQKSAKVKNNLGALFINSVAPEFTEMDISVQNGTLECVLPASAYKIYATGSHSSFVFPVELTLNKSDEGYQTVHQGYNLKENTDKSIVINSRYSDVTLQN